MRFPAWAKWSVGVAGGFAAGAGLLVWLLLPPDLPVPPQTDLVIVGVTVINPGVSRAANQTITVHKGRIVAVRPRRADDPAPICPGCYAMPGLIDAHVHTPPRIAIGNQRLFALMYLEYGVTAVRDLGQSDESIEALAATLNEGRIAGPHMYRCGPVLDGDPSGWPSAWKVTNAAQGTAVVEALEREHVDCIKVYNAVSLATYKAIAAEAARMGLPMIGHVPHAVGLDRLHDFEAQHLTGVPYLTRPSPPPDVDLHGEDLLAMGDAEISHALDIFVANRISLTPTIANQQLREIAADPHRFPPTPGAHVLPDFWVPVWESFVPHARDAAGIALELRVLPRLREFAARARARGVDVLAGTDTLMPFVVPGEGMLHEIDQLALAYGDREAALAAATTVNARHVEPRQIGGLMPGARADILLLPSDPTKDLRALRGWRIEIADGRRYDRAKVDGWVNRYRRHFHSWLYRTVMNTVAALALGSYQSASSTRH